MRHGGCVHFATLRPTDKLWRHGFIHERIGRDVPLCFRTRAWLSRKRFQQGQEFAVEVSLWVVSARIGSEDEVSVDQVKARNHAGRGLADHGRVASENNFMLAVIHPKVLSPAACFLACWCPHALAV